MPSKMWTVMNDLDAVTSKICSAREILDCAIDRLQEHQYDKVEQLMYAVDEFLQYYLAEFDGKFQLAWQETIVKQKSESYWEERYLQLYNRFKRFAKYTDQELAEICNSKEKEEDPCMPPNKDKVKKWVLPVEEVKDTDTDETEYFVTFPDDLLETADLKEGDQVEWFDNGDGSFTLKKVTQSLGMDEC